MKKESGLGIALIILLILWSKRAGAEPTPPADIVLSGMYVTVETSPTYPNRYVVRIHATATNHGSQVATRTFHLYFNGQAMAATKTRVLQPSESKSFSLYKLIAAGKQGTIGIDGQELPYSTPPIPPANGELPLPPEPTPTPNIQIDAVTFTDYQGYYKRIRQEDLPFSPISGVVAGQRLSMWIKVKNYGTGKGYVNVKVVCTATKTSSTYVEPGEAIWLQQDYLFMVPGTYTFNIYKGTTVPSNLWRTMYLTVA